MQPRQEKTLQVEYKTEDNYNTVVCRYMCNRTPYINKYSFLFIVVRCVCFTVLPVPMLSSTGIFSRSTICPAEHLSCGTSCRSMY